MSVSAVLFKGAAFLFCSVKEGSAVSFSGRLFQKINDGRKHIRSFCRYIVGCGFQNSEHIRNGICRPNRNEQPVFVKDSYKFVGGVFETYVQSDSARVLHRLNKLEKIVFFVQSRSVRLKIEIIHKSGRFRADCVNVFQLDACEEKSGRESPFFRQFQALFREMPSFLHRHLFSLPRFRIRF